MAAGTYNFTIEQGVDLNKTLTFYTDATRVTPVDLSGYTIAMQIRKTKNSVDYIDSLTSGTARIDITNAATGIIILKWTAAITAQFNFDEAVYDLEFTDTGVISRQLQGTITLDKEVTK